MLRCCGNLTVCGGLLTVLARSVGAAVTFVVLHVSIFDMLLCPVLQNCVVLCVPICDAQHCNKMQQGIGEHFLLCGVLLWAICSYSSTANAGMGLCVVMLLALWTIAQVADQQDVSFVSHNTCLAPWHFACKLSCTSCHFCSRGRALCVLVHVILACYFCYIQLLLFSWIGTHRTSFV
jgi:hypothetical protein